METPAKNMHHMHPVGVEKDAQEGSMLSNLPKMKIQESKQINETRPKTNRVKKVDCSHVLFRPV